MTINFIPNDPKVIAKIPMRVVTPRAIRPANRARINVDGPEPEGEHAPGTPEFLFWQCREAALLALEAWEEVDGPFTAWQDGPMLDVFPNDGVDLNAFYDRPRGGLSERVSFFNQTVSGKTFFSGASTDVVAHELGHAFLDSIRPDFWTSNRFEVNAFHEAFGDCVAMITALHDKETRKAILATVAADNVVESTAEDLSEGIKKLIPGHNAGVPRKARNKFQWGPQGSIPEDGGPGELIFEVHSFGQVFTGCFYDTIVNIFSGMSATEVNLLKATQTASKLLINAVRQAPQRAQYFREVGRLMILLDEQNNAAANRSAIRDAFEGHSVPLGATLTLAPQAFLAAAPAAAATRGVKRAGAVAASSTTISTAAKRELLKLIGADTNKIVTSAVNIAGQALQEVVHERMVQLDGLGKKLKGVVAAVPQVALVGQSNRSMAIMGHVSNAAATVRDVEAFVASLIAHGQVNLTPKPKSSPRGKQAMVAKSVATPKVTHEVQDIKGQMTLVRLRFSCRSH